MTTGISWTDETWNPITGCDRTSPGCDHCYALTMAKRLHAMGQPRYQSDGDPRTSGPGFSVTTHSGALRDPLRWRKPRRVFVGSMGDLFHGRAPREFLARIWATMAATPQHTYQILTKRPGRMAGILDDRAFRRAVGLDMVRHHQGSRWAHDDGQWAVPEVWPLPNVWCGTSVENGDYTSRIEDLRATTASIRFLSLEPLLGPLPALDLDGIDWVIVGGESGPGARPMMLDWVRDIRDQCHAAGVALHIKQLGSAIGPRSGADWDLWPDDLRIREYPTVVTL
jgi:protein gp37